MIQITKAIQALINDHFQATKVFDGEAQISLSEKTDALEVVKYVSNVKIRTPLIKSFKYIHWLIITALMSLGGKIGH